MTAGLLITIAPVRLDQFGLGDLSDASGLGYVPSLCFLAGDVCLAAGVWRAAAAARSRPLERLVAFVLGAIVASLVGACLRSMLQIVVLRDFYRPALFFSGPARAAAVGWGMLLTVALLAGFVGPAAVALANLVPSALARHVTAVRWLAGRRSWLLWPFAALAVVVIVTQWALSPSLAAAMGYRYLAPSGTVVTFSLRDLGPLAWKSLQILFALPLLILMWEGVESARTCQRLVRTHDGGETRLLKVLRRIDPRVAGTVVVLACGALAVLRHSLPAALAGIVLLTIVSLSFTGQIGQAARLSRGFERGVRRWQLPEDWRDLGRFSLILAVLTAPAVGLFLGDVGQGAKSALWLPSDLHGFYFYWRTFDILGVPSVTAAGLYGHVDSLIWIVCLALAAFLLLGMLIQGFRREVRKGFAAVWFLLRVGVVALLLAPIARLADHSIATALLTGCAVVAVLLTFRRSTWPMAIWSVVVAGSGLALWSFALWRLAWIPAAAMLALTIAQRFVYNAGDLNTARPFRSQRVAYFQSIALLSVAMLVLGHGAAPGYFESEALSSVADHVSLSVVAMIWLIMLTAQAARAAVAKESASGNGPAAGSPPGRSRIKDLVSAHSDDDAQEDLPASWSWMLDPRLELVPFIGRDRELTLLTVWAEARDAARLRLVTGPGGSGKTRLAVELCKRGQELGWTTIWIVPGQETDAIGGLDLGPGDQVLLIVDNAEARQGLERMIAQLVGPGGDGVRVLLIARSSGGWYRRLGTASPAARDLVASALTERLDLSVTVKPEMTDPEIVWHGIASISREFGLRESRVDVRRLKDHKRQNILELLAEALAATMADGSLADTGTGTVQVDLRRRLDPLLQHEQEYWYACAQDAGLVEDGITATAVRQAVACICLLGAASVEDAAELATRITETRSAAKLSNCFRDISEHSRSWLTSAGFLHPHRMAELLAIRELLASETLAQLCLTGMTSRTLRVVSFLAQAVPDFREATALLSDVLAKLDETIPDPRDAVETLSTALGLLPEPNSVLAPSAATVVRQLLEYLPGDIDPSTRAHWLEELSRWLSNAGDESEAVIVAREAVALRRSLTEPMARMREEHLPSLVLSLENLAERLKAHADLAEQLAVLQEATLLARDLVIEDPGLYRSWLARLLVSLSAGPADARDPGIRAAEATEAVELYQQAASDRPGLYEGALGLAMEVLSLRLMDADRVDAAVAAGSEAAATYEGLLSQDKEQYRPNLARALDNQGVFLAKVDRHVEALAVARKAVAEYASLRRARPGEFIKQHALALQHLSGRYRSVGQSSRAAATQQQAARLTAIKSK